MQHRRRLRPFSLLLALSLAAAACGGGRSDDDDAASASGEGGEEGGEPAPAPGFDGETIKVAAITPTSGPVAVIGDPMTNGNRAYWDYVNEELGGIAGKYKVELVVVDSKYEPPVAVQKYNEIKNDVVLINQLLGTGVVKAVLEQLDRDGIVAQPATLDSDWVREPNLIPIGAPYQIQAINGIDWYVTEDGGEGTNLCALLQDDPYGEAAQEGIDFALENLGLELAATAKFPVGNPDFTSQIKQLQNADCDMVWLTSTPTDTGTALGKAAELGFAPKWFAQSPTWVTLLGQSPLAPYLEENFYWVSEGAQYGDESVEGMAELVRIKDTYAPDQDPDPYFNFGYLEGRAVHQLLEKAVERGDLSREGIQAALTEIEELEFDGLFGNYGWGEAADRNPPRANSIFRPNAEVPIGMELVIEFHEAPYAADFVFEG